MKGPLEMAGVVVRQFPEALCSLQGEPPIVDKLRDEGRKVYGSCRKFFCLGKPLGPSLAFERSRERLLEGDRTGRTRGNDVIYVDRKQRLDVSGARADVGALRSARCSEYRRLSRYHARFLALKCSPRPGAGSDLGGLAGIHAVGREINSRN